MNDLNDWNIWNAWNCPRDRSIREKRYFSGCGGARRNRNFPGADYGVYLFILQDQVVCFLRIQKPFEPDGRYSPSRHAQGPCRSPREIDDATFAKGSAIVNPHVN